MKFGYVALSDMETQQYRSPEELGDAVRQLQRMAHLPETGRFDRATQELMKKPRCGVHDTAVAALTRSARPESFKLNSGQWPNTDLTYRYDIVSVAKIHILYFSIWPPIWPSIDQKCVNLFSCIQYSNRFAVANRLEFTRSLFVLNIISNFSQIIAESRWLQPKPYL